MDHELMEVISREEPDTRTEWFQSLMEADFKDSSHSLTRKVVLLPKASMKLQNEKDFEECFVPKLVSIGPYHYDNPKLQEMKDVKKKLARQFILSCERLVEELYNELFKEIKELRELYEVEPTNKYNDEALTQMMLVDGCFVLYYMYCILTRNFKDLNMKSYQWNAVFWDLMLVENQLPFRVLELLLGKKFNRYEGTEMIEDFIDVYTLTPQNFTRKKEGYLPVKPSHLLQILRTRLLAGPSNDKNTPPLTWSTSLPSLLPSFHSATYLMAKGIHFMPSLTHRLTDVHFSPHRFSGHLKLPLILIHISTKLMFLNLIDYEMSPDVRGSEIQSYICFLQSLITQPEDVKEVRAADIFNRISASDEEVVKIINAIAENSVPDLDMYMFVQWQIEDYLEHTSKTTVASWWAEINRKYFKSPWTIFALGAAIIGLSATIVQTIFTVWPRHNK